MSERMKDLVDATIESMSKGVLPFKPPRKVAFKGLTLWFMENAMGNGPLATLEMCDDDGHPQEWDSYAYVENGLVKRFSETIGVIADLIPVDLPVSER